MSVLAFAAMAATAGGAELSTQLDPPRPVLSAQLNGMQLAQVIIQRRTIVRVSPVFASPIQAVPIEWKEKSAPKCVAMNMLAGLAITRPDSIDLVLRGGQRLRAKLDKRCPSVDFYSGFYVKPNKDGRICKDRDTIHSRTGGACEIDQFRLLVASPILPKKTTK
jgi:hypothetical protein